MKKLGGKKFEVYLYPKWGCIHSTDARGKQIGGGIKFKTAGIGIREFTKIITKHMK